MTNPRLLALLAAILFLLAIAAYGNSFHNSFHFDDSHTIVNNIYIRNIANIPLFFKDGTTFSALPTNYAYRPVVTATLAIDYWLGKGLSDTFYFHLSMFVMFLLQGLLMYVFYLKIFDHAENESRHQLAAILATGGYLLHPSNAETINYIISRSDSYSSLFIVLALLLYVRSTFCRKWHLYLIPVALGMLTKPISAVFPLLLLLYLSLFDETAKSTPPRLLSAMKKAAPSFFFSIGMLFLVKIMTPPTWVPGVTSKFNYLITQPFVILKYFISFFLPISLSADTDLEPFTTVGDFRFLAGILFLAALISVAVFTAKKTKLKPISFGILWFFTTLLPTSLTPLAEVMNDHRVFLPYIGLMMSVVWSVNLLLIRLRQQFASPRLYNSAVAAVIALLLLAGCYGTHSRNEVWRTEETLWRDVAEKSPKNGRGLMNYGLALMARAEYAGAEKYFLKALEFTPNYSILHINLGVLYEATGNIAKAEEYFKKGISLQPEVPDPYFFYARFLKNRSRYAESIANLEKTLQLSPAYMDGRYLLMEVHLKLGDFGKVTGIAEDTLRLVPGDKRATTFLNAVNSGKSKAEIIAAVETPEGTPEYYLNLSLAYYRSGEFAKCVTAAEKSLQLKPGYDLAYNNICSAYIELKDWDKAIEAGEKAVKLNPGNQLAKNNLARARERGRVPALTGASPSGDKTPEELLNLSLAFYQAKDYRKSIAAARQALAKNPDYDPAYNNICAAYNGLKEWDKAIDAGEQAVRLNPASQLARNNLAWAKQQKAAQENPGKANQ